MPAEKVRVLHIFRCLELGGLENRILRLAKGLDPQEFQVDFLTFRKTPFAPLEPPPSTRHTLFEVAPGLHPQRLLALSRFIRDGRYDIVHTHNWSVMFYGILAARLAGVPRVFHGEHGMDLENLHHTSWKRLLAQKALARMADRVVCVNEFVADHNKSKWRMGEDKFRVIHNGVDIGRFQPRAESGSPTVTIGTVGRMVAVKDYPTLLRAFRLLLDRLPGRDLRLLVVGDGPERQALGELAGQLGIAERVDFPGELRKPEDGYRRMDLFVNTSRFEGMSNTILESMACGLPVIASAVPGNQIWLTRESNALFYEVGNAQSLADRMRELVDDPAAMAALGRKNRARVERDFDNQVFLKTYRQTYFDCLEKRAA
ncbi:MAG TPA: glycosyltransferase [Albitalea sp.]|uniref:glycosyltransferase n=1 Tax=Piscinibacter sp. TaxID=1903157 RepID=UPI002ED1BE6C